MKTSELTGAALDWAVAIAQGFKPEQLYIEKWSNSIYTRTFDDDGNPTGYMTGPDRLYSRKWEAGGPIIEREKIGVQPDGHDGEYGWVARKWHAKNHMKADRPCTYGPTPLIAAMRCYCCSTLGDTVDIPEELNT